MGEQDINRDRIVKCVFDKDRVVLLNKDDKLIQVLPITNNIDEYVLINNALIDIDDKIEWSEYKISNYKKRNVDRIKDICVLFSPFIFNNFVAMPLCKTNDLEIDKILFFVLNGLAISIDCVWVLVHIIPDIKISTKKVCLENIVKKEHLLKYKKELEEKLRELKITQEKVSIYKDSEKEYKYDDSKYTNYINQIVLYSKKYNKINNSSYVPASSYEKELLMKMYEDDCKNNVDYKSMIPKRKKCF